MATDNETFILKEFIAGLIVILLFLFLLLMGLRKITGGNWFKDLFSNSRSKISKLTEVKNYCADNSLVSEVKKDLEVTFKRTVKRPGWLDKQYQYIRKYNNISNNKIISEITSENTEVNRETISLNCLPERITFSEADNLLLASLLDSYPEKLTDFATYKITKSYISLPKVGMVDNNIAWPGNLSIRGGLKVPYIIYSADEERNCFNLEAKAITKLLGKEKLATASGEMLTSKFETVWEASVSASLGSRQKITDCYVYNGPFDNNAMVSFREESWYNPDFGLVKRNIIPVSVSGQAYFLPNGNLPLEITDEIIAN